MAIHLREDITRKLSQLPETGMGYQIVDLVTRDGSVIGGVTVYDGSEADLREYAVTADDIVDVRLSH
jgi:hypothetical protein